MAVAFDAKMTAGNSTDGLDQDVSAATSITSASGMTVGASASLLVAVLVLQNRGGATPGSLVATWNGVSMPLRPTIGSTAGTDLVTAAIFTLVNPATGTHSLSASWTGSNDAYLSCVSFTGTDTTTGINATDNTTATQTTTITVPSTSDGATVAVFAVNGNPPTVNFNKIFSEAPFDPGGGASYHLGGSSNAHTFTGAAGTRQALAGVHVIAAGGGGGGRTFFVLPGLDGHSSAGPKQFNPTLYHRHPAISLEAYRRERARAHREFLAKVRAA